MNRSATRAPGVLNTGSLNLGHGRIGMADYEGTFNGNMINSQVGSSGYLPSSATPLPPISSGYGTMLAGNLATERSSIDQLDIVINAVKTGRLPTPSKPPVGMAAVSAP